LNGGGGGGKGEGGVWVDGLGGPGYFVTGGCRRQTQRPLTSNSGMHD
jgi:hypothetical protein